MPHLFEGKGKVFTTTLSDSDSSNDCTRRLFGEHTKVEPMGVGDESNDEEEELQLLS